MKKKTVSSQNWLKRWHKDPYVKQAKKEGFRSRSAFKIIEINDKFKIFKAQTVILEIGAAPGGWTEAMRLRAPQSTFFAVDKIEMSPIEGVTIMQCDVETPEGVALIQETVKDKVNVVVSDAAPNTIGHAATDQLRFMSVVEAVWRCAELFLVEGGIFVCKGWQSNEWSLFVNTLRKVFDKVQQMKPPSSHKESREVFVIAQGYQAGKKNEA